MTNLIKNITYPFYLKENDFKEEHNKAFVIKKWLDENGQELAEYILRHQNHYALNGYKDVLLKDFPSAITKNNLVFKPIKELIKNLKDEHNKNGKNILILEKYFNGHQEEINNNITQARKQKQNELFKEQELKKQELIEKANNLTVDMGLDIDQIQDEQVRVMEKVAEIDKALEPKELKKVGINIIKDKLLVKDIEVIGIDDDFVENANQYELIQLIKYLIVDEKLVKNTIKAQWDTNTNTKLIGIKGIKFKINKGDK